MKSITLGIRKTATRYSESPKDIKAASLNIQKNTGWTAVKTKGGIIFAIRIFSIFFLIIHYLFMADYFFFLILQVWKSAFEWFSREMLSVNCGRMGIGTPRKAFRCSLLRLLGDFIFFVSICIWNEISGRWWRWKRVYTILYCYQWFMIEYKGIIMYCFLHFFWHVVG